MFVLLLVLPGLAAVVVNLSNQLPPNPNHPVLSMILARVDSGFQLGMGPYFLRAWLMVLTGFTVLVGVQVPVAGRKLWLASWAFQAIAVISALNCSHPFEALQTVADTALLNVVALLAFAITPRTLLPAALSLAATVVAVLSIDTYIRFPQDDSRLTGTFHQPNMTATFMAAALPWLLNHYMRKDQRRLVQFASFLAGAAVLTTLLLTATRAAWLFAVVCLGFRWWLGGFLRTQPMRLRHLLGAATVSLVLVLTYWLGTHWWLAFAGAFVIVALGAYRSGLRGDGLILVIAAAWLSYGAFATMTSLRADAQANVESRVRDLSEGTDYSLLSRLEFWRAAVLMGLENPGLGVGPRGFHRYYPSYQQDQRWFSKYAHSSVLSCWAELGIPGTVLLAGLAGLWLSGVGRGLVRLSAEGDPSALLDAITSSVILTLCASVDVQWQFPTLTITWAAWLGYSLALAWPEQPVALAAAAVADDQPIHAWTLRPRVLICYLLITVMGVGSALNLCWAFGQYYSDLSEELLKRGKVVETIECDKRALQLNPFQASYYHHLGLAYSAALSLKAPPVKLTEYLAVAERAVRLDSHRAVHYDLLSKALRANHKPAQAREALHKALECDPVNYPSFYTTLAEMAVAPGEKSQRERLLLACVQRFPAEALESMFTFRSSDISRQMSESYLLLAELSDPGVHPEIAVGYYEELLKIKPDDLPGQMGRFVCLVNLNRLKEAHKLALKMYYQSPQPETLDALKHVYQFETIPFDPTGLPPIPARKQLPPTPTPGPDQLK